MNLEVHQESGFTVVEVQGVVDIRTSPKLREVLKDTIDRFGGLVAVRLADIEYMDSSGVGVLVASLKHAKKAEAVLALVEVNERVRVVLQMTRLCELFPMYADLDEAREQREESGESHNR